MWRALRVSLGIAAAGLGAWTVYAHPDAMTVVVASIGGVGALIGVLMKIIGDFKTPFVVASTTLYGRLSNLSALPT